MLLMIEHNPYSEEPEELFELFKMETGTSYLDVIEPDREALRNLQDIISPQMAK